MQGIQKLGMQRNVLCDNRMSYVPELIGDRFRHRVVVVNNEKYEVGATQWYFGRRVRSIVADKIETAGLW